MAQQIPENVPRDCVITEVTHMSETNVCIAAWDQVTGVKFRPCLPGVNQWTEGQGFSVGQSRQFTLSLAVHGDFPHRTEDRVVTQTGAPGNSVPPATILQWMDSTNAAWKLLYAALTVEPYSAYVTDGTNCPSFGPLVLPAAGVEIWQFTFGDGSKKDMVTFMWNGQRIKCPQKALPLKVQSDLPTQGNICLCLGVARAWAGKKGGEVYNPKRCYLQVNGFLF